MTVSEPKGRMSKEFYPLFEELNEWPTDIDRVKLISSEKRKKNRITTLWNKLKAMKKFNVQLKNDKDKVGRDLVDKIKSSGKKQLTGAFFNGERLTDSSMQADISSRALSN